MGCLSFLNKNGLANGKVPPNKECPFWNECKCRDENCPSVENNNLRDRPFSCAAARAFSMMKDLEET